MPRLRFSLRTLLVVTTLIAIGFAGERYYQHVYVHSFPYYHVQAVLRGLRNGDTYEDVAKHFISVESVDPTEVRELMKGFSQNSRIADGDQFWRFKDPSGGFDATLHFRNGLLVNYQPSHFDDPVRMAKLNHQPVPPLFLRFGFWPIFAIAVGFVAAMTVVISRIKLPWNRKPFARS